MALNQPFTLQDVQDQINTNVNNDNDSPSSGDDDWNTVLNLINQAINLWQSQDVFWRELWKTYTHASPVANNTTTYTVANTDFKTPPGGYVRFILDGITSYVAVISPEQYQTYRGSARVCYFTGNNIDGWVLNLGWTPATGDGTVGATIKFDYYKIAHRPDTSTDKFEMSDPSFIVNWVSAQKALLESQNNKFSVYNTLAQDSMDHMRVMNEIGTNYNGNTLENTDAINYGASLGE